jgi:chromosomal replication initiation ATPase DnaA
MIQEQLSLNITPRLAYGVEGFALHAGVATIVENIVASLHLDNFFVSYVHGGARTGKTHLSIYLADRISRLGRFPRLISGEEILQRGESLTPQEQGEVLLVDDLDRFLLAQCDEASGPFVRLVEAYRLRAAPILFLATVPMEELPHDGHVMSRLRAGSAFTILEPAEDEMRLLIELMAKQRGIRITQRTMSFLLKRLPRSIPEIESYLQRVEYLSTLFGRSMALDLFADAL